MARDLLAYTFWPDDTEDDARANLRRHLHRINQALPPADACPWLLVDKKTIAVNPAAPIDLDVARLEAACAGAALPASALDLYAGDLCEGCDDDWILAPRERLRAGYVELLARLIGTYRGERRFDEGVALAQRMLQLDPFREDTVRALMSMRYESGDRAGALRDFELFRERLQTEIGATPMHHTQSLHDAIRRHAPLESNALPAAPVERAPPFAGRAADLEALLGVWRQAASRQGRTVLVCGEAGIGKSRLLREFATLAEREGARVLWGATSAPEATPYEAVIEALRGAASELGRLPLSPALIGALTAHFPELRQGRDELPVPVALDSDRERSRFFDAVGLAVARLGAARPTVLVLEDLHWAREGTLELLLAIVRSCATASVLTIASYREEEIGAPLRVLLRHAELRTAVRSSLARLEETDCASILARAFVDDPLPAEAARWATRLSGGNPLFLGELAREYRVRKVEAGALPGRVPESLETTILARLARASEAARNVAAVAAVAGSVFSVDVLHRALGWPLAEVLDGLDELVDRFIVRETATGSRGDYQFAHELIRDALLTHMPADVRVRRHRRLARALLEIFPERADELARALAEHFAQAGLASEGARYYARAAHVALAAFAWQEALTLAQRALELDPASDARFEVLACMESAHGKLGNPDARQAAIDAMQRCAEERDDDGLRAVAGARQTLAASQRGDAAREREAIAALTTLARRRGDPRLLREARRAEARRLVHDARAAEAAAVIASVDAIEGLERSPAERVADLCLRAHAHGLTPDFERGRAAVREAEELAEREGGPAERIAALRARLTLAMEEADHATTARLAPLLLDLCRTIGDVEGEGNAHQTVARGAWWSFDVAAARTHLAAGIAIFERIGKPLSAAALENNAGALENHVGRLDAAERHYARARALALPLGSLYQLGINQLNLAYLAYAKGDLPGSLELADLALESARSGRNRRFEAIGLAHRATALRDLHRYDEAFECFAESLRICEELGFSEERRETLAEMLPVLAARGDTERVRAVAEDLVAALAADAGAVAMPVDALAKVADALARAGDPRGAVETRARARALLADRLARLPDEPTRAAYAALRWHRALLGRSLDVSGLA